MSKSVVYQQMGFEEGGWECSGCDYAVWWDEGEPTDDWRYCPSCGKRIERSELAPDPYAEDEDDEELQE